MLVVGLIQDNCPCTSLAVLSADRWYNPGTSKSVPREVRWRSYHLPGEKLVRMVNFGKCGLAGHLADDEERYGEAVLSVF
ncbi:uncharacterized protein P174DRAFT_441744 [Aspergillus novofumigatus IBT 16806]|uniref:Uncharacterized protein n=1 Tax=Aspergillus novofumigatus (strain IBT 16806) TaxID=1392255 RepID=A0A2I1CA10_ASPN1|nr:uncharacterized protein P174DRAFT_441744 [Aspergillus novofumigatus IBT 16806]PKX94455.1 hypothetical protein P174DRAFT_441744 [Aspergillus novofumigatus IBT 16806]